MRDQVCQQASLYNFVVAPFGQKVLQDTCNFFKEFNMNYSDLEELKDSIDLICEDTIIIVHGFDISTKIHGPVLTQAEINKMKANAIREHIQERQVDIGQEFREIEDKMAKMQLEVNKANPSQYWNLLPLAGVAYVMIKKRKVKLLEK